MRAAPSWFQRFLLPAFAFKAVVIGGGYATGRELAQYFLPSGPRGGLLAMLLATLLWCFVCTLTFLFARSTRSTDYRTFFAQLLGRAGVLFELVYLVLVILLLAVFGAAAGAIATLTFGLPAIAGSLLLVILIAGITAYGNEAVERLFKYVTVFLYATYALFLLLCLSHLGPRIVAAFSSPVPLGDLWPVGGITYAGYNVIGAIVVLPVTRHLTSRRDAVVAGVLCGPVAMLPAFLFFVCMAADYPAIAQATLPSDILLLQLHLPAFRILFQVMIFAALLESGASLVHAVNERIARSWPDQRFPAPLRLGLAALLLLLAVFLAGTFGLVVLIASGYRLLAWLLICVYVLPLLTLGTWKLARAPQRRALPNVIREER